MNLFLSRVMFSVKKVSFPAKAAVYVFPNLITHVQMMGFESVTWKHLFFTGFKVVIYWWMIKMPKGVGMSKTAKTKYQEGVFFFLFINQNLCPILTLFLLFLFFQILH